MARRIGPKPSLPPLEPGVTEFRFRDFFKSPVGSRGLEPTERLQSLHGKRVRLLGFMVHQEQAPPGRFLLAPLPADVHEHDSGLADDLPPGTVYVSVPTLANEAVPYAPGLMLLTGTLSFGNRAEPDGRISVVRLALDPPGAFEGKASTNTMSAPSGRDTGGPPGRGVQHQTATP